MMFELFRRLSGPRGQRAALLALCLTLALSLALGRVAAGLPTPAAAAMSSAAPLRAHVGAAGWVTVRVDLRAAASAEDLEQRAQDLLFALPAGSYDAVERAAGSASLTLRVDAAGLDALLGSPWAASVAATDTPEMQRLAAGFAHSLVLKPDGSLLAWGYNYFGQLGDGTTTHRLSPVAVAGFGGSSISDADFTVTNVNLNPSAPLADGTFNAAVTVKNRGTQAGNPGLLRVWANPRATQDCNAPGDAEISLASLAAGATQTVSIRLPAGTAGSRTLLTFIDSQCQIAEPNEANNQAVKDYRVFAQRIADFAVTAIDLTPDRPTAGGTFSAAVTVKNRGTAAGEAGALALWVDQPEVRTCGAAGDAAGDAAVAVGPLAAGASRTLTLAGLPAGTAATKSLRAYIDHTCVSAEAYDDSNNQRVKPYTVVP